MVCCRDLQIYDEFVAHPSFVVLAVQCDAVTVLGFPIIAIVIFCLVGQLQIELPLIIFSNLSISVLYPIIHRVSSFDFKCSESRLH